MNNPHTLKTIRHAVRAAWCECAIELRAYSAIYQPMMRELMPRVTHESHGLTVIEFV